MYYYFRHHDEDTARPAYFDHALSTIILTGAAAAMYVKNPVHILTAAGFGLLLVAPTTWFYGRIARFNSKRHANIFYQNDCTKEEIERF